MEIKENEIEKEKCHITTDISKFSRIKEINLIDYKFDNDDDKKRIEDLEKDLKNAIEIVVEKKIELTLFFHIWK